MRTASGRGDRSVGEEVADDMGNDEQRKRMHKRLDAGENPYGVGSISEAPLSRALTTGCCSDPMPG
eukprot:4466461-Amphidinium_carterae.6